MTAHAVLASRAGSSRPGGDHPLARTAQRGMTLLGIGAAIVLAAGVPSADAATPAPSLSVAIDNGHTSTTVGDVLVYTITLRNLGTSAADRLFLRQSLPTGLQLRSSAPVGKVETGAVGWTVSLRAGATATLRSTAVVTATAPDTLRLATVACASSSPTAAPIVCASHSDQLPAGAAQAAAALPAAPTMGRPGVGAGPVVATVVGGGVVVGGVLFLRRRNRPEGATP